MTACACGCGVETSPGATWLYGHQGRGQRRVERRANGQTTTVCPTCRHVVSVNGDGTLGSHWTSHRKGDRMRCPGGSNGQRYSPSMKGRRVLVAVDVVIPDGWAVGDYATEAGRVLREHAADGFVVSVEVAEDADSVAEVAS